MRSKKFGCFMAKGSWMLYSLVIMCVSVICGIYESNLQGIKGEMVKMQYLLKRDLLFKKSAFQLLLIDWLVRSVCFLLPKQYQSVEY